MSAQATLAPATEQIHTPRPAERQRTSRAILAGYLLRGVVSCKNIYMGLKIGCSFGGSLIAAILGFGLFTTRIDP